MTRICSRIAVGLLALVALCTLMTPALAAPSTNYKLTGNEIDDIIAVASAQTAMEDGVANLYHGAQKKPESVVYQPILPAAIPQ